MRAARDLSVGLAIAAALAMTITGSSVADTARGELVIDGKMTLASPAMGACHKVTVREGSMVENRTAALAYFFPDSECRLAEPCMVAAYKGGVAHATGLSVMFLEDKPRGY